MDKIQTLRAAIIQVINDNEASLPEIAGALAYVLVDAGANVLGLDQLITEDDLKSLKDKHNEQPLLASALILQGMEMLQWLDTEKILNTTRITEQQHGKTT